MRWRDRGFGSGEGFHLEAADQVVVACLASSPSQAAGRRSPLRREPGTITYWPVSMARRRTATLILLNLSKLIPGLQFRRQRIARIVVVDRHKEGRRVSHDVAPAGVGVVEGRRNPR